MERDIQAFRRLAPDGQVAVLRGEKAMRAFTIDANAIDEAARTAWLSIASDRPYERWWGVEILDMGKKSIRAERLDAGAALLVGHDPADQVGVVERYEITSDKKLRILARFSKSARAEEIWRDVLDGIRRNASVGYVIHDLVLEKQEGDTNTYRVTDWEPLEGSLVSVPADPSVGVGRSVTQIERKDTMEVKTPEVLAAEQSAAEALAKSVADKVAAEAVTREQERVKSILAAGDEFAKDGGAAIARKLAADPKATQETFKAEMLEALRVKQTVTQTAQPAEVYGAGARAHLRYAPLKAFTRKQALENGKEMPAEEAAYRAGMWLAATVYGREAAQKWCKDNGIPFTRVMSGATNSAGGALVPLEMENAIIDLRDTYGVARKLARVRPMASDTLNIPRRKTGLTAAFMSDVDGTGFASSDKSWDSVNLVAKKLGVLSRVSKDLVDDAIINVVDDLSQEMAYAFAVKEDNCLINGDGTSTYGGMQGYIPKIEGTAYKSRVALTTGHDLFTEVDATDLTLVMGGVATYAKPGAVIVCSETAKSVIFDRLKASAGGNDVNTLGNGASGSYLGYPIFTSEAMPIVTTTLVNKVMFLFGRPDLASSMGSRRGIEIQVLQERYAELGQLGIIASERFDIVVHDLGDTATKGPLAAGYGA